MSALTATPGADLLLVPMTRARGAEHGDTAHADFVAFVQARQHALLRFAYPEARPEPDAAYLDGDAELCLVADCTPDDVATCRDVKARYLTVHDGSPALVRTQGDEASRSG